MTEGSEFHRGVEAVLMIRCMPHQAVPQLNRTEANKGECGACISRHTANAIINKITARMATAHARRDHPAAAALKKMLEIIRRDYEALVLPEPDLNWNLCDTCGKPKHVNCDCE